MAETNCKREIELEIPADNVQKATEKVVRVSARVARVPGFRPGKAPVTLIRRRFADDIQGEVVQSLVPEYLEKALDEKKLIPVTRPKWTKWNSRTASRCGFARCSKCCRNSISAITKAIEAIEAVEAGDAQVDKTIEELRERAATFVPVEGRAAKDGDYVLIKLNGTPVGDGDPVEADNILCHIGAEETLESFKENLRGASPGETKQFRSVYPADYPDQKLAGKTYDYVVEVQGIKEKKLPELNDEFAKDAVGEGGGVATLAEMREKIHENLVARKTTSRLRRRERRSSRCW